MLARRSASIRLLVTYAVGALGVHHQRATNKPELSGVSGLDEWLSASTDTDISVSDSGGGGGAAAAGLVTEPVRMPALANRSLEALVGAWLNVPPRSVSREMLEELSRAENHSCAIAQVISNKVYVQRRPLTEKWYRGRLNDVAWLLKQAAEAGGEGGGVPDVEMLVCTSDSGDGLLASGRHFAEVPVLTPVTRLQKNGSVPVPMLARRENSFWRSPWVERLISGAEIWRPIAWQNKLPKAFFRGTKGKAACSSGGGRPPPDAHSHCFREYLLKQLRHEANFNVSTGNYVNEAEFDNYMFLLIIGNSGGWSDRTMQSLFKSSVAVYVDQGAYEWYMPLLVDEVHYLRVDPTPDAVKSKVAWALQHRSQVKGIVQEANKYAHELFSQATLNRYMSLVARAYAGSLAYTPTLRHGMQRYTGE